MSAQPAFTTALSPAVAAAVWRGNDIGRAAGPVVSSGWSALDRELPGGGWPCGALTEVLASQPSVLEWRLLGGALRQVAAAGGTVVLVGPPKPPYLPGLRHLGIDAGQLLWVRADTPAERLWATEQLIQADGDNALLAWLPQARPDQLRRLHSRAQGGRLLLFALRPDGARHESSPAGLRLSARAEADWTLRVQLLKRRGPAHDVELVLPSFPGGLDAVLPLRPRPPGRLPAPSLGVTHVVGRTASARYDRHLVDAV